MIYFSSLLPKKLPRLYHELKDSGLEHQLLTKTKDIWARDYMAIKVGDRYIQFHYSPSYLKGYNHTRTNPLDCLPGGIELKQSTLIVDGGNVVYNNSFVVMTTAVFKENNNVAPKEVRRELEMLFYPKKLIFIPTEEGDMFGHADGMLRFIDNNLVVINDYYNLGYTQTFINQLYGTLRKEGIHFLYSPYEPEDRITSYGVPSAKGNYINFLETTEAIYLPQFNMATDKVAFSFFYTDEVI